MTAAISVENLSKLYRIGAPRDGGYRTLRESLVEAMSDPLRRFFSRARQEDQAPEAEHWALKDVSFQVQPGDVVGVIGRNGAGKSTMLKVLSRITEPHSGRLEIRGRVGSLLEVGVGFHHELSGRENIYLNGAIFGMTRREISRKFDSIVDFAEVGPFLDTPVKRYSSGMYVRLAFSVASHMEPEILIIDEVLAVGDSAFQKKCLGRMGEVSREGRTVVFVSHNMATVSRLCDKVILLEHGRLAFEGGVEEGISRYTRVDEGQFGSDVDLVEHPNRRSGSVPILGGVRLLNRRGESAARVLCGENVAFEVTVHPKSVVPGPQVAVGIEDSLGSRIFTVGTYLSKDAPTQSERFHRVICRVDSLPLAPGRYCLTINAGPPNALWADMIDQALWFEVESSDYYGNGRQPNPDWGKVLLRSRWEAFK